MPVREYAWAKAFMVWLSVLAAVVAIGGFFVGYYAVDPEDEGVALGVIVGVLSGLLAATPLIALAVLIHLAREIAVSAGRIDGWAEANFELDRLYVDAEDHRGAPQEAHLSEDGEWVVGDDPPSAA